MGAERGTARPGLDCRRGVRKSQEINSIAKLCQCKSLHNIFRCPNICGRNCAPSCTFANWIGLIDHLGHAFLGAFGLHSAWDLTLRLRLGSVSFLVIFNCLLRQFQTKYPNQETTACCICRNYARKSNAK